MEWTRLARFGLFASVLAVALSMVMTRTARLFAQEGGQDPGNHCRSDAVAYSYYYSDGSVDSGAGDFLDEYGFTDYGSCLNASQALAMHVAGRSCVGVSRGTYGIAYAHVLWDVFWNDAYQGTVDQQYDCGDVSVY